MFRLTMQALGLFIATALALGVAAGAWLLAAVDREERDELEQARRFLREIYVEEEGLEALIEELSDGEEALWSDWQTLLRLWEHEPIALLSASPDDPVAGYPALAYVADWAWQELELIDDEGNDELIKVRTLSVPLDGESHLIVAMGRGWRYHAHREGLRAGLFWLLIIALPLSLITGYALSRQVYGRLDSLSHTAEQVGEGQLHRRVQPSGHDDEFDRLGARFNQMLDRLEALHRNVQDVSVGIAHDLKTPVTHLDQRLRLIAQDLDDGEAVRRHLTLAHKEIDSLLRTFQALLRLGEIESGRRRAAFSAIDLSQLVVELAESFEPVFVEHDRRLEHSVISGITVQGDADLLTQMITNLLENSIEHGRAGGRSWIRLQTSAHGALLQIGDDGPGIPTVYHGQLFDRFFRADKSRSTPGNGLGLSIAKAVCTLHDAHIEVQPGQPGAVFDVHFSSSRAQT